MNWTALLKEYSLLTLLALMVNHSVFTWKLPEILNGVRRFLMLWKTPTLSC
ncbi:hypothetical protein AB205_0187400 [Aquarana catesbeiana]|uniref:Uncharacterized protein n=1 Tax=Aquarana catesbeiana TaxID=8400 RepID=A0A2G9RWI6_AQUCT|nr:hypothetical protein AB205_0187400 [Aquarana catesbeiana]